MQWTPDMLAKLNNRLNHLTFTITNHTTVMIELPAGITAAQQPRALRAILQAVQNIRWRRVTDSAKCEYHLTGWSLTPSLFAQLSHFPSHDFSVSLALYLSKWSECPVARCRQFFGLLPQCVNEFVLTHQNVPVKKLQGLCEGAAQRGAAAERVRVCVQYMWQDYTDAQRSQVEACVSAKGLGRHVEVEWCLYAESEL